MKFLNKLLQKFALPKDPQFELPEDFIKRVQSAANETCSKDELISLEKAHLDLLNCRFKDQYKATIQYSFLSERFNAVPDLLLRSEARAKVLKLTAI